jgi:uncharacterized membrane protein YfcA
MLCEWEVKANDATVQRRPASNCCSRLQVNDVEREVSWQRPGIFHRVGLVKSWRKKEKSNSRKLTSLYAHSVQRQHNKTADRAHSKLPPAASVLERGRLAMAKSENDDPWEYSLRKYLLLLATLVATLTYSAGFNPPGGVWQNTDDKAHQLAGDPIIRDTSSSRYLAFFYCNATAFASSLVVIVLLLILSVLHEKRSLMPLYLRTLRVVMVMDLLSLMGAYAAGTCRDVLTTAYSSSLAGVVVVYVAVNMAVASQSKEKDNTDLEQVRKVLMLLATFAVSVTYLAGLSAPGGFWDHDEGRGSSGHAVLQGGSHDRRLKAFFVCNTTAFATSLLIIVLLLDKKLSESSKLRYWELYGFILVTLAGLIGAYSAGSCREVDTTVYVNALIGAVLIAIFIQVVTVYFFGTAIKNTSSWRGLENMCRSVSNSWRDRRPSCLVGQTDGSQPSNGNGRYGQSTSHILLHHPAVTDYRALKLILPCFFCQ